jgi:hypothetical protein
MSTDGPETPTPEDLDDQLDRVLAELEALDGDARLRRVHDVISDLAFSATRAEACRWRDKIVGAGHIGRQDWREVYAEARQRVERSRREARQQRAAEQLYIEDDGCLYLATEDGGRALLARFLARVVGEVTRDDGAERHMTVRIRVTLPTGHAAEVDVPAERLHQARRWAAQAVGASAVISPMSRDDAHVATAAQILGAGAWSTETVYSHTGWRVLDGSRRFLSASGALGAAGLDTSVTVDLGSDRLNGYALPDPTQAGPAELQAAVLASLDLLKLAPHTVMVPMLAAAYRAPLPLLPETSVYAVGPTGSLKTALSAVVCQHFGRRLDAQRLPAEWKSTSNALEALAYQLAGVLMVIDDYAPQAAEDPRRLAAAADRVFRGSANASARSRLRPDGTMRPARPPRAQVLSTGEDVPPGESLRARLTIASVDAGAVDLAALTKAQRLAAAGVYELAMAGYVRWLAGRQDADPGYAAGLRQQIADRRAALAGTAEHLRVPEAAAGLLVAWRQWLEYTVAEAAVPAAEAEQLMVEVTEAVRALAAEQATYARQMQVARIYLSSLASALAGGGAHLADQDSGREPPADPNGYGWEPHETAQLLQWHPRGVCIGWVSRDGDVYLSPGPAYEVARAHAAKSAVPLATGKVTVHKRLHEGGHLATVDPPPNLTVRRRIAGKLRRVLHVHADLITGGEG